MNTRILWAGGALLSGLVAGIVVLAPASKVIALSGIDKNPKVRIHEADGRILNGSIQALQVGTTTLKNVHWTAHPLALLTGKIAADLNLTIQESIPAQGLAKASLGGRITLENWRSALTLEQLKPILRLPFLPVEGRANVQLDEVRIGANQRPEHAQGRIDIHQLSWTLIKPAAALGDFVVDIETRDDGVIVGTVSDKQAKLGVSGTIELQPDGRYDLRVNVAPRAETPAMIRNTLPTLGRPGKDGSYPLVQKGRIPGW